MSTHSYLTLLNCAIADLEGMLPVIDPSGDRTHPAWKTLDELKTAAENLTSREILFSWSIEDVQSVNSNLSDEQAFAVLEHCDDCHDAEIGMNWSAISAAIDCLYPDIEDSEDSEDIEE